MKISTVRLCPAVILVDRDPYTASALCRLNDDRDSLVAIPLERVRFAGCLTDQSLPVEVCCDVRIAGSPLSHPADDRIRINGDGISGVITAENAVEAIKDHMPKKIQERNINALLKAAEEAVR